MRPTVPLTLTTILAAVALLPLPALAAETRPAATQPSTQATDAKLQIHSVRIGRAASNLQKQFAGRYYGGENNPGVSMQLLLSLTDTSVLPLAADAVSIESFLDDTYQHLLGTGRDTGGYRTAQPVVSDDGRMILFTVTANRPPADDAGRVFVRGAIDARIVRGDLKVESAKLGLVPGQRVTIGPFTTVLRALSDNGGRTLSLTLGVEGDGPRIRKVRVLDAEGRSLNEERETRVSESGTPGTSSVHINVAGSPKGEVTLELSYAEKLESVRIPFEAQADIGVVSAGPMRAAEPKAAPAPRGANPRAWPPPPADARGAVFPPRRAAFDPDGGIHGGGVGVGGLPPAPGEVAVKFDKASVDLFSLTLGKPAPGEAKGVRWANPPAAAFHASGFTIARLMVTTPDASILSIPPDGVKVARFEDDTGAKLGTEMYLDARSGTFGGGPTVYPSPDGRQGLLTVSLAAAPTPGATKCTLGGSVRARVARDDRAEAGKAIVPAKGQPFRVGPFEGTIGEVRLPPPLNPGTAGSALPSTELLMYTNGPIPNIRSFELLDAATGRAIAMRPGLNQTEPRLESTNMVFPMQISGPLPDQIIVRIRHFRTAELVDIPFEVTTGLGL